VAVNWKLTTEVGPLAFRLADVRAGFFDASDAQSLLTLEDGTTVKRWISQGEVFLLVDHRSDPGLAARIEFWECETPPEIDLGGLFALCDSLEEPARHPAAAAPTSLKPIV
jgi:hypothetical protein